MGRTDDAVMMFNNGANCAQSVLCSLACDRGLKRETAMSVAAPFGGGMGRMGATCGVVTGAFMAFGIKHATEKKNASYDDVREFARLFTEKHGSLLCRDLLGCDISTPDGMKEARDKGLYASRCVPLVSDAVEIAERLMK